MNFSNDKFPFMTFKVFNYMDTEVRIMRASFTGELGYEIYITPNHGLELWKRIFHHGNVFDLVPYGTETMHLLRAEKGYVVIGQETDGTVTPLDLNFNWMIGKNKKDFIGKRSLYRPDTVRSDRKQLVGLSPINKSDKIEEGQHIVKINKLPNKLLLSGQKGIGKSTLAYHLVNYALSKDEEFNYDVKNFEINRENKSYKLTINGSNPNINVIDTLFEKKTIDIDPVSYTHLTLPTNREV